MPVQRTEPHRAFSRTSIPRTDWASFLQFFTGRHRGWLVWMETHDKRTGETVVSRSQPLLSVELDTEDERHPRINITVKSENKVIRRILFLPSKLALYMNADGVTEALHIESVNTSTTIYFRAPAANTDK